MQAPDATVAPLRPFGEAEDLDVDFGDTDRPALVTALLARCVAPYDATFWWSRGVGARIAMLLRLMAATARCRSVELSSGCQHCAAIFEFELPIDRLVDQKSADDEDLIDVVLAEARHVVLRRPTGEDQRAWRASLDPATGDAIATMLEALRVRGAPQAGDVTAIAQVLSERDPLVDFSVQCDCPACGAPNEVSVDLEGFAITRLRARQRALLRDVHDFARHYGWTEGQTLAVPPQRRALYRALIEESA
jgi:hypothetical protein